MKVKKEFRLSQKDGENIIVSDDNSFTDVIVLNREAAFIFNLLKEKDCSKGEMFNALIDNFDISVVLALSDVDIFIKLMKENDIIE